MFRNYPDIYYPFTTKEKEAYNRVLKDITVNLKIRRDFVDSVTLYDYYDLGDWETPDVVAGKYYNNPKWHYLVILANDKFDWRNDYPLTQNELEAYVRDVYVDPNGIHHYEDENGVVIQKPDDTTALHVIPVTNYEYEYKQNEAKRRIRLIRSDVAGSVVTALNALLG